MAEYVSCLLPLLFSIPPFALLFLPFPSFPPSPPRYTSLLPPLSLIHLSYSLLFLPPPNTSLTCSPLLTSWMAQTSANTTDFIVGQYVSNRAQGLRSFPYSTSPTTNPLRYSSLQQLTEVHDIGEVWANMLHQVYAALVAARGFSNNKLTDANGKEGNIVFMRVMIDALAIQPCNPTCAFSFLPLSVFGPSFLFFFILSCFIFLSFPFLFRFGLSSVRR